MVPVRFMLVFVGMFMVSAVMFICMLVNVVAAHSDISCWFFPIIFELFCSVRFPVRFSRALFDISRVVAVVMFRLFRFLFSCIVWFCVIWQVVVVFPWSQNGVIIGSLFMFAPDVLSVFVYVRYVLPG